MLRAASGAVEARHARSTAAEGFSRRASADVVDLPRAFDPGQGMSGSTDRALFAPEVLAKIAIDRIPLCVQCADNPTIDSLSQVRILIATAASNAGWLWNFAALPQHCGKRRVRKGVRSHLLREAKAIPFRMVMSDDNCKACAR